MTCYSLLKMSFANQCHHYKYQQF